MTFENIRALAEWLRDTENNADYVITDETANRTLKLKYELAGTGCKITVGWFDNETDTAVSGMNYSVNYGIVVTDAEIQKWTFNGSAIGYVYTCINPNGTTRTEKNNVPPVITSVAFKDHTFKAELPVVKSYPLELYSAGNLEKICGLPDVIKATVTEELNSSFEMNFSYPVIGENADEIQINRFVYCKPNPYDSKQLFRIYRVSKEIKGIITAYAEHYTYSMNNYVCFPSADYGDLPISAGQYIAYLNNCDSINSSYGHYYSTLFVNELTETSLVDIDLSKHSTVKECMSEIVNKFGGEWKFDGTTAILKDERGTNRNVSVEYSENMTDYNHTQTADGYYTHIMPYWKGFKDIYNQQGEKTGTEEVTVYARNYFLRVFIDVPEGEYFKPYAVDVSNVFGECPLPEMVESAGYEWIGNNYDVIGYADNNYSVGFVQRGKTAEYSHLTDADHVELGDYVQVINSRYGINVRKKCVKTVYNVLLDMLTEIELGTVKKSITDVIARTEKKADASAEKTDDKKSDESTGNEIPYEITKVDGNTVEFKFQIAKKKITWYAEGTGTSRKNFTKSVEDYEPEENTDDKDKPIT